MKPQLPLLNAQPTQRIIPQIIKSSIIPLQPSQPIHIHHNKILSIKTESLSKISSKTQYNNPLGSLLYGGFYLKYRKFESIIPSEILLAGQNNNKLRLDGLIDWAIFPKDALISYSGVALNVSLHKIPWGSGLSSLLKLGYLHISGRGDVYLQNHGEIYTVNLGEKEEIIVRKNGVVGISVNGDELGSCCDAVALSNHEVQKESQEVVAGKSENELKDLFWNTYHGIGKTLRYLVGLIAKDDFVKVRGPRSLILTSNVSTKFEFPRRDNEIEITEQQLNKSSQDYLSYVTVKDGKVTFESTPSFKETVEKIERK
ncbi:unnamed protein product [Wickerhamomyces anomalus]